MCLDVYPIPPAEPPFSSSPDYIPATVAQPRDTAKVMSCERRPRGPTNLHLPGDLRLLFGSSSPGLRWNQGSDKSHCMTLILVNLSQPEALEKGEIGESLAGMHMLLGRISASEGRTETRNGKIQQFQLKKKKE